MLTKLDDISDIEINDYGISGSPHHMVALDPMNGPIDRATEQALQRFMARVAQHYPTRGGILYGSRARGDHHPNSDADLLVLLEGEHQRFVPTKLGMTDLAYDVLLESGLYISPLPIWTYEWEHPETWSNPALLRKIACEGILV